MIGRLTALLTWIALPVTHTNEVDPVVFLAKFGGVQETGGRGCSCKSKRKPDLTSFLTSRYRQRPLTFGGEMEGGEGGEGGEGEEGEGGGQARARTDPTDSRTPHTQTHKNSEEQIAVMAKFLRRA
jgi:hypothetical protein